MIKGLEVFEARYEQSMGDLVGVRFKFLGLGKVQEFLLQDQSGQEIVLR